MARAINRREMRKMPNQKESLCREQLEYSIQMCKQQMNKRSVNIQRYETIHTHLTIIQWYWSTFTKIKLMPLSTMCV